MAVRFDASDESLSRTTNLPASHSFTVMGWFRIAVDRDAYSGFISFGETTGSDYYYCGTGSDGVRLALWNGVQQLDGTTLSVDTWYHVAVVVDGTGTTNFRAYLNGVLDISNNGNSGVSLDKLWVGNNHVPQWLNGRAAHVRVWTAPLSLTEIQAEMVSPTPVRTTNLNGSYPLVDDTQDESGSGNHWTEGGTLSFEAGPEPLPDVIVDSVIQGSPRVDPRRVVFVSQSVGYVFYTDADNDFKYVKTTNGGASWGSPVTIYAGTVRAADVWFDRWTPGDSGTKVHLFYMETDNHDIRYRALNTADDSLSTEVVVFNGASVAVATLGQEVTGTKAKGGNLYCYFNLDNGTEAGFYRSTDGGTNWTSRANPLEAAPDFLLLYPGNEADTQDIWALYDDASANSVTLKTYDDSANSWAESAEVAPHVENSSVDLGPWPWSAAVRADGHLIVAIWTERDSATGDFRVFDINGSSSITEKTALATNVDDCYYPQVFIDPFTNDIYVSYTGKRDGSETLGTTVGVYYAKSTDGGTTWTTGDLQIATTLGNIVQNYAPLTGDRFLVIWFFDDVNDSLRTNFAASLVFAASGGAQGAAMYHHLQNLGVYS